MGRLPLLLLVALALLAGCGGGGSDAKDPAAQVPAAGGVRAKVRAAQAVTRGRLPGRRRHDAAAGGRRGRRRPGPSSGSPSSVFTVGENRLAFGVIDDQPGFVYGKTALYVAPTPGRAGRGPVPGARRRADHRRPLPLQAGGDRDRPVRGRLRRRRCRSPSRAPTRCWRSTQSRRQAARRARPGQGDHRAHDQIPDVGDTAPKVATDTVASAKGDVELDRHARPADATCTRSRSPTCVGKKPVALLFATPQLCQSRVCGPVVDVALQMKAKYGDQIDFIHQEVYADNDPNKGLREPLQAFHLQTEPWLFVVGEDGRITARLEGSFGLQHSRTRSRPPCEHARLRGARDGARRRWRRAGAGVGARARPAPAAADPASGCSAWAAAIVLVVSFVALAALWPQPRLEQPPLAAAAAAAACSAAAPVEVAVRRDRRRAARACVLAGLRRAGDARSTTSRRPSS